MGKIITERDTYVNIHRFLKDRIHTKVKCRFFITKDMKQNLRVLITLLRNNFFLSQKKIFFFFRQKKKKKKNDEVEPSFFFFVY